MSDWDFAAALVAIGVLILHSKNLEARVEKLELEAELEATRRGEQQRRPAQQPAQRSTQRSTQPRF